jgi:hypothetical protein
MCPDTACNRVDGCRVFQALLCRLQARTQAAVAVALSGDVQQALEWEAHQQLLPPPPLTPALVQQWRYAAWVWTILATGFCISLWPLADIMMMLFALEQLPLIFLHHRARMRASSTPDSLSSRMAPLLMPRCLATAQGAAGEPPGHGAGAGHPVAQHAVQRGLARGAAAAAARHHGAAGPPGRLPLCPAANRPPLMRRHTLSQHLVAMKAAERCITRCRTTGKATLPGVSPRLDLDPPQ